MKAEGKRDRSRLVDRIWDRNLNGNRVMIWCYGSVDEWCQSRGAAFWRKEVNSWLISRSDKQLALPHSGGEIDSISYRPLSPRPPSALHTYIITHLTLPLTNPSWATLTQHWLSLDTFYVSSRTLTDKTNTLKTKGKFALAVICRGKQATSVSSFVTKFEQTSS